MKETKTNSLLTLLVFTLFALSLLLVLLTGAKVYRQIVRDAEDSSDMRTKTQYLSTRVHQSQQVTLEPFGDGQALALREEIDGECYVTYIYCHEGWLRELFCAEGANLGPEDGEKVIRAEQLEMEMQDDLLTARLDGQTVVLRCES